MKLQTSICLRFAGVFAGIRGHVGIRHVNKSSRQNENELRRRYRGRVEPRMTELWRILEPVIDDN